MKTLTVYFSWSNNTKRLAESVGNALGCSVERLERKVPYSTDYNVCAYVEAKEENEKGVFPEIKPLSSDPFGYDRILLFFPVWWYTFPAPVGTFLKSLNGYEGELIYFANSYTDDPKYMLNVKEDIKKIAPRLRVKEGLFNKSVQAHLQFINGIR